MDEILASIRKIISEDPSSGNHAGPDRRRGASNVLPRADALPPSMPNLPSAPPPQAVAQAVPPMPPPSFAATIAQPPVQSVPAASSQSPSLDDDLADLLDDAPEALPESVRPAATSTAASSFDGTPDWLLARVAPSEVTPALPPLPDLGSVRPSLTMAPPLVASTAPRLDLERVPTPPPAPVPPPTPLAAVQSAPAAESLEADLARVAAAVAAPVLSAPKVASEPTIDKASALFKPMPVAATPVVTETKAMETKAAPSPVTAAVEVPKPVAVTPAVKVKFEPAPAAAEKPAAPVAAKPADEKGQPAAVAAPAKVTEPVKVSVPPPMAGTPAPVLGVQTMEDTVAELLRPMLRQWLDTNMPRIVEKALRVEMAESLKKPAALKN